MVHGRDRQIGREPITTREMKRNYLPIAAYGSAQAKQNRDVVGVSRGRYSAIRKCNESHAASGSSVR